MSNKFNSNWEKKVVSGESLSLEIRIAWWKNRSRSNIRVLFLARIEASSVYVKFSNVFLVWGKENLPYLAVNFR